MPLSKPCFSQKPTGYLPESLPDTFRKTYRNPTGNPQESYRNPTGILPETLRNPTGILPETYPLYPRNILGSKSARSGQYAMTTMTTRAATTNGMID